MMNDNGRMLLLFSGSRNDFNRVLRIAELDPDTDIDLLHIRRFSCYSAEDFPQDVIWELFSRARNIVGCYYCDGLKLQKYARVDGRSMIFGDRCQYCQLVLNMVLATCIRKYGYKKVIWCSPLLDDRLYKIPMELILPDAEYLSWDFPISDYGIASTEVDHRYVFDTVFTLAKDRLMQEKFMQKFCQGVIDSGVLDELSMEEADLSVFM